MTVREGEVGRIVRHWMARRLYSDTYIRQREVRCQAFCHRNGLYGVAFLSVGSTFQGVFQLHIRVEWVILRTTFALRNTII